MRPTARRGGCNAARSAVVCGPTGPGRPCGAAGNKAASHGGASLAVLLLLLMATLLVSAWAQRNVLTELRISTNQVRGAVAFEAAEAGLAWAQAMLNAGSPLGRDCQPSSAPGAMSFRNRYLGVPANDGRFTPRNRGSAGHELPLQMLCARQPSGWACDCPESAGPSLSPAGAEAAPAFLLQLIASTQPGAVEVVSIGCNHLARPCLPGAAERAGASTRLRMTLALLPAVSTPPAAVLTALGDVEAGPAALGLHNADALSGGLAAQTGGRISGPSIRVRTAPGAPAAAALLSHDEALSGMSPTQLFSRHFGTDLVQWVQQPGVRILDCSGECATPLMAAWADEADVTRIAVRGDLQLSGNMQIGSTDRPVVLVVDGLLRLSGPVQISGLVYARGLRWDDVGEGGGGLLHGAALLSQGYLGDGAADLVYDAGLMFRLKHQSGSWLRVPGSWRDF